jgi:ribosomal protein L29
LENISAIKLERRELARLMTVLTEKEKEEVASV